MTDSEYKLRVASAKKRVEVNDNGEFIEFDIGSADFFSAFEKIQMNFEKNDVNEMTRQLEKMFGENACKKIFGVENPSIVLLADFFLQIFPILEENILKTAEKFETLKKNAELRAKARDSSRPDNSD
jgi:hypothetical protein